MVSELGNGAKPTKVSVWSTPVVFLLINVLALAMFGMWVSSVLVIFTSALIGAVLLPRNALPATALWLLVLLPLNFTNAPTLAAAYFTPAVVVITVWMIRVALVRSMNSPSRTSVRGLLIAIPFLALLAVSALVGMGHANNASLYIDTDPGRTFAWIAVLIICVIAPALLGQTSYDDVWPTVQPTFAGIGLLLGALATVDFLVNFNPWSDVYTHSVRTATWSVFRAQTSLGHPLVTSTVAAVALVICLFPAGEIRRWPYWIGAFGAFIAVVLSASRNVVVAVALATVAAFLAARTNSGRSVTSGRSTLRSMLIAVTVIASIGYSPLLTRRSESSEGLGSEAYRLDVIGNGIKLVTEHPIFGFGPGTSNTVYAEYYTGAGRVARLENSLLQLAASVGLPAFLLFLVGVAMVVGVALKRSRSAITAGLVAFFVSIAAYNALEANTGILALISPLLFCAVAPTDGRGTVTGVHDLVRGNRTHSKMLATKCEEPVASTHHLPGQERRT